MIRLVSSRTSFLHRGLGSRHAQPALEVIRHPERVGHDGERRVHGRAGGEEAPVDDVEIVQVVCLAVHVEHRCHGIAAEAAGPVLVGDPREWDAFADIGVEPR